MVIDNWRLPCKYHIGNLEDIIYLQSFDDKIEYYIDDAGEPYCSAISGALSSITCESVLLTEESSFDTNRFAFTYELTAVFREGNDDVYSSVLKLLRENKYRLYVKTTEGMYYLVNAEYPYSLSYEYVWSNTSHHCTLKFTLNNNIPTMKCTTFPKSFTELIPKDCGYFSPRINEFNIIEEKNVLVGYNASELNYTQITTIGSNTWKTIEHLDDSFVYTHTYSGGSFSNTIQFDIELSDYLTTFHYNILEFVKNRYVVKFKSSLGNTIIVGDKCGLFPSFSLNTSDSLGSLNRIRITLRENTSKDVSFSSVDVVETVDDSKKHGGTSDNRHNIPTPTIRVSGLTFPTIECISPTMAKRILMPQINVNGDETSKYYVLDGYQDYFGAISDLIIGTYDENTINNFDVSLYVTTNQCQNDFGCLYSTTLNDRNYLINSSSSFFAIISSCGWEIIQKDACLTFDRLSGESGVQYVVDYSTSCAVGVESSFTIKVGDDEYTYIIKKVDTSTCFISNPNASIVASAATLTFEMSVNANEVAINGVYLDNNDTDLLKITLIGNTMTVNVPEYTDFSGYRRYFTIRLESNSGGNCEVEIIQDHPYKKQVIDLSKYECLDGDKYYVYQYYSGYTLDTIDTPTGEYYVDYDRSPWERNSPDCTDDELIKWFDAEDVYYCETTPEHNYEKWSASTEYICDGTDKYVKDVKMVSDDGETWSATTDVRMGELIAHNSADCGFCPKQTEWRDDTAHTICDGVSLRYLAYQWESNDCGETWTVTPSSGYGTVISEDTVDCGGTGCTVTGDSGIQYKWVDNTDKEICLSGNAYYVSEQYYSISCGNIWEKTGSISIGGLKQSGATECSDDTGTTETMYKWEDSTDNTVCVSGDSYYVSYRYVSYDSGTTWISTGQFKIGSLKERNASECSDEHTSGETMYKWVQSETDTTCYGNSLYYVEYEYSSTDNGKTWVETGNSRLGSLIEVESPQCQSGTRIYKWEDVDETICFDGDLYYKCYRFVSYNGGIIWARTNVWRLGELKEKGAEECTECELEFKWIKVDDDYLCDDETHTKYEKLCYYFSDDCWITSHLVDGVEPQRGEIIETDSFDCGFRLQKWEYVDDYCYRDLPEGAYIISSRTIIEYDSDCSGTTKITTATTSYQESYDSGETWETITSSSSVTYEVNSEDCGYIPPTGMAAQYLTLVATSNGTFKFNGTTSANTISFSTNSGTTWSSPERGVEFNVQSGDTVMWKGTDMTSSGSWGIGTFGGTATFEAQGNVMSLLYGDNFYGETSLSDKDYIFSHLFNVSNIVDASNLVLPYETLSVGCYYQMFQDCTSLTAVPELKATTLAQTCYYGMFQGCTSLTTAPQLPATTLGVGCYEEMFYGCTSLTTPPQLPATTLANNCYKYMFSECTSLTIAPDLLAPTLTIMCYERMFQGCSSLNYIKMLATDVSAANCLASWVVGVSSTGTFVKDANTNLPTGNYGYKGIPNGWTVENITS